MNDDCYGCDREEVLALLGDRIGAGEKRARTELHALTEPLRRSAPKRARIEREIGGKEAALVERIELINQLEELLFDGDSEDYCVISADVCAVLSEWVWRVLATGGVGRPLPGFDEETNRRLAGSLRAEWESPSDRCTVTFVFRSGLYAPGADVDEDSYDCVGRIVEGPGRWTREPPADDAKGKDENVRIDDSCALVSEHSLADHAKDMCHAFEPEIDDTYEGLRDTVKVSVRAIGVRRRRAA